VAGQLVSVRLLAGRRRTHALIALCGLWGASWALIAAGIHAGGAAVIWLLVLAAVIFGLGETLLAPTVPALVNDLAPEHLRGRYNGAAALAYTSGFVAGPLLSGFLLGHSGATSLFALLIAGCAGCALLARRLDRQLPRRAHRAAVAVHRGPALLVEGQPA
jgi:MFS family permease